MIEAVIELDSVKVLNVKVQHLFGRKFFGVKEAEPVFVVPTGCTYMNPALHDRDTLGQRSGLWEQIRLEIGRFPIGNWPNNQRPIFNLQSSISSFPGRGVFVFDPLPNDSHRAPCRHESLDDKG